MEETWCPTRSWFRYFYLYYHRTRVLQVSTPIPIGDLSECSSLFYQVPERDVSLSLREVYGDSKPPVLIGKSLSYSGKYCWKLPLQNLRDQTLTICTKNFVYKFYKDNMCTSSIQVENGGYTVEPDGGSYGRLKNGDLEVRVVRSKRLTKRGRRTDPRSNVRKSIVSFIVERFFRHTTSPTHTWDLDQTTPVLNLDD